MAYRNYSPSNSFTVDKLGNGDFTTIGAALTAAVSGDTIFIRPGTYTENPTLKAGVNLTAFGSDSSLNASGVVIINGNCTLSTAGTVTISGIMLQTNSAPCLTVSGSVTSVVNLNNCYINALNNTAISFSSSSASSQININNCGGNINTTGIALFAHSSGGTLFIQYCMLINNGASTTNSTVSSGNLLIFYSTLNFGVTTSSTSSVNVFSSTIQTLGTALTVGGTSNNVCYFSYLASGTASALSIGTGVSLTIESCNINSSNTNAITGLGTITYSGLNFTNTSSTINTTTQTNCGTLQGSKNTAPSSGFLGEQLVGGGTVALSNGVIANVASVSLTPGVWDISLISLFTNSGATTDITTGISSNSASFAGVTVGSNGARISGTFTSLTITLTVPAFRQVLSATTSYFLVADATFSTGANSTIGQIRATRVG